MIRVPFKGIYKGSFKGIYRVLVMCDKGLSGLGSRVLGWVLAPGLQELVATLGSKVYRCYRLWALGSPRVLHKPKPKTRTYFGTLLIRIGLCVLIIRNPPKWYW